MKRSFAENVLQKHAGANKVSERPSISRRISRRISPSISPSISRCTPLYRPYPSMSPSRGANKAQLAETQTQLSSLEDSVWQHQHHNSRVSQRYATQRAPRAMLCEVNMRIRC